MGESVARLGPASVTSGRIEENAANPRQLAAMPLSTDNKESQKKNLPRSNTAKVEEKLGMLFSKRTKDASKLTRPREKAANCRGVAVSARGTENMLRGFVHFGWGSGKILT